MRRRIPFFRALIIVWPRYISNYLWFPKKRYLRVGNKTKILRRKFIGIAEELTDETSISKTLFYILVVCFVVSF